MVFEQPVADAFALVRVANHDRDDVAGIVHRRDAHRVKPSAHLGHAVTVACTFNLALLQVADAGGGACGQRRRQSGGEDEAAGKAADEIAQRRRCGDIATHHAERLAQRALDHGHAVHQAFAFGNAAATRTIEADTVDFIEIGHRAVLFANIQNFGDWRDVAVHRIDAFERDQFGQRGIELRQPAIEIFG